ncbi:nucleolar protein [Ascochyta rabiei]|uniref:Nucleic acid binding n=1 Tax=Didymella rabiei TaxID=5454 RepID=A0A163H9U8_DIDRA|nr:nucleolar protein [Ascochyta rabiei]KZM25214.1 nucleic acid binding [Ascochyta rabiei]UPX17017.1 nucleolar protein [Ascochyta rabiei]
MAAADLATKKRKGASDAAPKAKKPRKSDDIAAPAKPAKSPKAAKAAAAPAAAEKPAKKSARKQAEDFFSDNEAPAAKPTKATKGKKKAEAVPEANGEDESMLDFDVIEAKKETPKKEAPKAKATKAKKGKKEPVAEPEPAEEEVTEVPKVKATKAKKGKKQQEEPVEEVVEVDAVVTEDGNVEDAAEEDDQTAALLAGFGSDDSDSENDIDFPEDEGAVPKLTKSQKKAIAKAKDTPKATEPGVIYVGRVPRGFFEPQMKKYFSQFGRVLNLRLSRNKKTGGSKHYAFVEFASAEVADIVARTMNNYLMFGHILKCSLIPKEQVNENLFKGAGTRFKVDPRNKKAGLAMERGAEREVWEKRVEKENKRRSGRNKDLKETMDYEFTAPTVKAVKDIPASKKLEVEASEPQQLLNETAAPAEPKGKKGKKPAAKPAAAPEPEPVAEEPKVEAPAKKTKKRKSDAATELLAAVEEPAKKPAAAAAVPKAKKAKKAKA